MPGRSTLLAGDVRTVLRDPTLVLFLVIPLLIALLLRFGMPTIAEVLQTYLSFDLVEHYPFAVSVAMLMPGFMLGTVGGFMVLDDRDDGILTALAVTPLSRAGYLRHKIGLIAISCVAYALSYPFVIGLDRPVSMTVLPFAGLLAGLQAPGATLFVAAMATNKVEGLAVSKAMNLISLAPFLGYLAPAPWNILAWPFPTFWLSRIWLAGSRGENGLGWMLPVAFLIHLLWLWGLLRLFDRRVEG
jgi:fluoroquinolone transport system permease protein